MMFIQYFVKHVFTVSAEISWIDFHFVGARDKNTTDSLFSSKLDYMGSRLSLLEIVAIDVPKREELEAYRSVLLDNIRSDEDLIKLGNKQEDLLAFLLSLQIIDVKHQENLIEILQMLQAKLKPDPIRLIPWKDFIEFGSFPRYPDQAHLTVNLESVDAATSLITFISHCWLRGHRDAEGWDGKPHPDNVQNEKYNLCVKGIEALRSSLAPDLLNCYVWLDFGCINQDGNPAGELKQLDKIIECSDLIFTPLAGNDDWDHDSVLLDWFSGYKAKAWMADKYGYLNRGWCRVEMFYASNIPLSESASSKLPNYKYALHYHASNDRRPHFLYGTNEYTRGRPQICLPPLQNSYFDEYHPEKGHLSVEDDRAKISQLVAQLLPYMKRVTVGYEGDMDLNGCGHGIYTCDNGNVYEGEYRCGKINGYGTYRYADGNKYEGEWTDAKKNGHGIFRMANGDEYNGGFKDDMKNGIGNVICVSGDRYEGEWKEDKRHGEGTFTDATGNVYKGKWKDDKRHGHGSFTFSNRDKYRGEWKDDNKHGDGILVRANGDVYKGEWKNNSVNGHGTFKYIDGSKYEGEWKDYKYHGHGIFTDATGNVNQGEWRDGILRVDNGNVIKR